MESVPGWPGCVAGVDRHRKRSLLGRTRRITPGLTSNGSVLEGREVAILEAMLLELRVALQGGGEVESHRHPLGRPARTAAGTERREALKVCNAAGPFASLDCRH